MDNKQQLIEILRKFQLFALQKKKQIKATNCINSWYL